MKRIVNQETKKFRYFEISEEGYQELAQDQCGLCTACGEIADCVEPDAERYTCEACEKPSVYGVEQLLLMGRINFIGFSSETSIGAI